MKTEQRCQSQFSPNPPSACDHWALVSLSIHQRQRRQKTAAPQPIGPLVLRSGAVRRKQPALVVVSDVFFEQKPERHLSASVSARLSNRTSLVVSAVSLLGFSVFSSCVTLLPDNQQLIQTHKLVCSSAGLQTGVHRVNPTEKQLKPPLTRQLSG